MRFVAGFPFYILLKKLTAVSLSPHDTPPHLYWNYDFISDCYNFSLGMTYAGITIALNEIVYDIVNPEKVIMVVFTLADIV